jgi:hypothetical protein
MDGDERISDADRDAAVESLREHLVAGRLTLDEFGDRVDTTLRARTGADLAVVQVDLPAPTAASTEGRRRTALRLTAALFAHVVRRGRLVLGRRSFAAAVVSDIDLDLRDASVGGERTSLWVFALFGNVDVYVPEDVDVEVTGLSVMGHRRDWGSDLARSWSPTIAVRVVGVFGTVDVWRVPRAVRGDYGAIIKAVRHPEPSVLPAEGGAPSLPSGEASEIPPRRP